MELLKVQPTSTGGLLIILLDKNSLGKLSESSEAIQVLVGRACSNSCQTISHF